MSAKRPPKLSRQEVAIIKAMLAERFPSQDILAYFSRPGRSINMLRISEIRSGKKWGDVPRSSDQALRAYVDSYDKAIAEGVRVMPAGPLDDETITQLLKLSSTEPPKLSGSENETVEFKETFNWASPEHYAKAMVAFANNKGGYLLFGVNNDGVIVGTKRDKFEKVDSGKITQFLNKHFQPAISWDRLVTEIGGVAVAILYTYPAAVRPVLCVADKQDVIKDGDVYYRYGGRNDRIKSGELRHLMEQRERDVGQLWLAKFRRMATIGLQNVGILDSVSGEVEGPTGQFLIDKDLLDQVQFVQEGCFTEKEGAPVLKLVGEVVPVDGDRIQPTVTVKEHKAISEVDMLAAFLDQARVPGPHEYIRSTALRQSWWVPLYFFIRQAGIPVSEAVKLIEGVRGGQNNVKEKLVKRLKTGGGCIVASTTKVLPVHKQIIAKGKIDISDREAAGRFLHAVQMLKRDEVDLGFLLPIIRTCFDDFFFGDNASLKGHIRKATSHLDWLVYGIQAQTNEETASIPASH
jgi:hypothetical protein